MCREEDEGTWPIWKEEERRREEGEGVEKNSLAQKQAWSGVRPPNIGPHSQGDVKRDEIV